MENGAYRGDKIWNPKGSYNDVNALQSYNLSLQPQQKGKKSAHAYCFHCQQRNYK